MKWFKWENFRVLLPLLLIWLAGAISDRLWFAFDHSIPAWDQAEYLTSSLNYWQALQQPHFFSGEWWVNFWMLSAKMPPLTYILTAFFLNIFGVGNDKATLVHLLCSAILLAGVYGLGVRLFNRQVGLWSAGFCLFFPGLYRVRLDYLLDYPLTAFVCLSFYCLTCWKLASIQDKFLGIFKDKLTAIFAKNNHDSWFWSLAFGLCFGLSLLIKQTALFFILIPLVWLGVAALWGRQWLRLLQLFISLLITVLVCFPWYRTNWLLILTSSKRATIDSAMAEGDPALNTLDAWVFYLKDLPHVISWPLFLVPLVGLLIYGSKYLLTREVASKGVDEENNQQIFVGYSSLKWLGIFFVGSYLLCSLNINKDSRYVLPYLPIVALFLGWCLSFWPRKWQAKINWGVVSLAALLMLLNIWPVGGIFGEGLTNLLSPQAQHKAYLGAEWPHQQVIGEIIKTEPYLQSNLGVLPSTPEINQHNLNYYGALENFQVYGRQVGVRIKEVKQDARSMSWFVTKTENQGSVPKEAQTAITKEVEEGGDFVLDKSWNLPDDSMLKLYRRRLMPVEVKAVMGEIEKTSISNQKPLLIHEKDSIPVQLINVKVPDRAPPGMPLPVLYHWWGSWEELKQGIVLLSWQPDLSGLDKTNAGFSQSAKVTKQKIPAGVTFYHDHGIGMGRLHGNPPNSQSKLFEVIERMAMLPSPNAAGTYKLEAIYLNRHTGKSYNIQVPEVRLKIDKQALPVAAPELDLITQMRLLALSLPNGPTALGPIFEEIARINQYDPNQDYTVQAELALNYRLSHNQAKRSHAYALAFSRVLQRDVSGAISALKQVIKLDENNPYAYAYLAFVNLYNWDGKSAEIALEPALKINPNIVEIKALRGIAKLMQGNILQAWQDLQIW